MYQQIPLGARAGLDQPENNRDYFAELQDGLTTLFGPYVQFELRNSQPSSMWMLGNQFNPGLHPINAHSVEYTITVHVIMPVAELTKRGDLMSESAVFIENSPTRVERYQDLARATYVTRLEYVTNSLDNFISELDKKNRRVFERKFTQSLEDRLD